MGIQHALDLERDVRGGAGGDAEGLEVRRVLEPAHGHCQVVPGLQLHLSGAAGIRHEVERRQADEGLAQRRGVPAGDRLEAVAGLLREIREVAQAEVLAAEIGVVVPGTKDAQPRRDVQATGGVRHLVGEGSGIRDEDVPQVVRARPDRPEVDAQGAEAAGVSLLRLDRRRVRARRDERIDQRRELHREVAARVGQHVGRRNRRSRRNAESGQRRVRARGGVREEDVCVGNRGSIARESGIRVWA